MKSIIFLNKQLKGPLYIFYNTLDICNNATIDIKHKASVNFVYIYIRLLHRIGNNDNKKQAIDRSCDRPGHMTLLQ